MKRFLRGDAQTMRARAEDCRADLLRAAGARPLTLMVPQGTGWAPDGTES